MDATEIAVDGAYREYKVLLIRARKKGYKDGWAYFRLKTKWKPEIVEKAMELYRKEQENEHENSHKQQDL